MCYSLPGLVLKHIQASSETRNKTSLEAQGEVAVCAVVVSECADDDMVWRSTARATARYRKAIIAASEVIIRFRYRRGDREEARPAGRSKSETDSLSDLISMT